MESAPGFSGYSLSELETAVPLHQILPPFPVLAYTQPCECVYCPPPPRWKRKSSASPSQNTLPFRSTLATMKTVRASVTRVASARSMPLPAAPESNTGFPHTLPTVP